MDGGEGEDKEDLIMMDLFSLSYTLFPPLVIIAQLEGGGKEEAVVLAAFLSQK